MRPKMIIKKHKRLSSSVINNEYSMFLRFFFHSRTKEQVKQLFPSLFWTRENEGSKVI